MSVTTLRGGQEFRVHVWPEPDEELVIVTFRSRWVGFAVVVPRPRFLRFRRRVAGS